MSTFLGGGGTLSDSNKVQASLDLIMLITEKEKEFLKQVGVPPKGTWTKDMIGQVSTFAIVMPCVEQINAAGRVEMVPQNFLGTPLGDFDPGVGGDLVSTDLPSALVEHATKINLLEKEIPTTVATLTPNTHDVKYDTEARTVSVTISVPFSSVTGANDTIEIAALDFLA